MILIYLFFCLIKIADIPPTINLTSVEIILPFNNLNRNYSLAIGITPGNGTNITSIVETIYANTTTPSITNIISSIVIPVPNTTNSFVEVS